MFRNKFSYIMIFVLPEYRLLFFPHPLDAEAKTLMVTKAFSTLAMTRVMISDCLIVSVVGGRYGKEGAHWY